MPQTMPCSSNRCSIHNAVLYNNGLDKTVSPVFPESDSSGSDPVLPGRSPSFFTFDTPVADNMSGTEELSRSTDRNCPADQIDQED